MSEQSFDPYHKWLGIPPEERPINHYRLLGIDLFETNLDVIDTLSMRQISHVRTFAHGPYAELSQEVLNQLSEARSVLLNEKDKGVYDTELSKRLQKNKVNEPTTNPAITEKHSKESGRDFAKLQKYEETLREREKQLAEKKLEAEQKLSAVLRTLNTQREDALREVEAKQKEFTQKKEVFEQERIKERARIEEQEAGVAPQLEPSPNFSDAGILTTHDSPIDIDSLSVRRKKAKVGGSRTLSERTPAALISSFILIISAALLWVLVRFGESTNGFISHSPPFAVAPFDAQQAKAHQEAWAAFLEVPSAFKDPEGLDFVLIPAGSYQMGLTSAQVDVILAGGGKPRFVIDINAVCPPRDVTINQAFYLSVDEIANNNGKDWAEAIAECNDRSKLIGLPNAYRLPTSAEWEFACRAGNANPDVANPHAWGLKNMEGGLSEWVSDWHSAPDLTAGNDPAGPPSGKWKIHRGRGWNSSGLAGISAYRSGTPPSTQSTNIGYRIVLDVKVVQKMQEIEAQIQGNQKENSGRLPAGLQPDIWLSFNKSMNEPYETSNLLFTSDRFGRHGQAGGFTNNTIVRTHELDFGSDTDAKAVAIWFKTNEPNVTLWVHGTTGRNAVGRRYIQTSGGFLLSGLGVDIRTKRYVTDGKWHHALVTRVGNNERLYLDGVLVGQAKGPARYSAPSRGITGIGSGHTGAYAGNSFPDGSIDDFMFFKRSLNEQQVLMLYKALIKK